jgi:hypothetical protein
MKPVKALFLTTWIYSTLLWLYIVVRITINKVDPKTLFIDAVPFLSFYILGIIAFVISFLSLFAYLAQYDGPKETIK